MIIKSSALALVLVAASALQARAADPPNSVAWSAIASGCAVDSTSMSGGLAHVDATFGTVSFAAGKSGHIKLSCPIRATFPIAPHSLVLTYYNNNGYVGGVTHCSLQADLLRSNLDNVEHGGDLATVRSAGYTTNGRQTSASNLSEAFDFDASYYWVDVDLYRDSGSASCNPTLVGTYLSYYGIIY